MSFFLKQGLCSPVKATIDSDDYFFATLIDALLKNEHPQKLWILHVQLGL
jgi:hypothetical protein